MPDDAPDLPAATDDAADELAWLVPRGASRERNRVLAVALATIPAALFVVVVALGVVFHFAEVQHAVPWF